MESDAGPYWGNSGGSFENKDRKYCCYHDAHPQWGGAHCEGELLEETHYFIDGSSRFICIRHYQYPSNYALRRRHRFEHIKEGQ